MDHILKAMGHKGPPLLLFLCLILTQAAWLGWTLHVPQPQTANHAAQEKQFVTMAALAAQNMAYILQYSENAGKIVLQQKSNAPTGQSFLPLAQSGIVIPSEVWFSPQASSFWLSPPLRLAGQEYLLLARPLDGERHEIRAMSTAPLLATLDKMGEANVHMALALHTHSGLALLSTKPLPHSLHQLLALGTVTAGGKSTTPPMHVLHPLPPIGHALPSPGQVVLWPASSPAEAESPLASFFFLTAQVLLLLLALTALLLWRRDYAVPCPRNLAYEDLRAQLRKEEALHRQIGGQLIALLEGIRHSLARELHDHLGQRITTLLLHLESPRPEEKIPVLLRHTAQELRELQGDMRRMAKGLRPPALDCMGLAVALRSLCDEYTQSELKIHFFAHEVTTLDPDRSLALYRVAQEALTNITKHAGAKTVHVSLTSRGGTLLLSVEDDGEGFAPEAASTPLPPEKGTTAPATRRGLGLLLMRERMTAFGGTLTLDARPGKGTAILAEMPL